MLFLYLITQTTKPNWHRISSLEAYIYSVFNVKLRHILFAYNASQNKHFANTKLETRNPQIDGPIMTLLSFVIGIPNIVIIVIVGALKF